MRLLEVREVVGREASEVGVSQIRESLRQTNAQIATVNRKLDLRELKAKGRLGPVSQAIYGLLELDESDEGTEEATEAAKDRPAGPIGQQVYKLLGLD